MLIAIEGIDGSGKTTIANFLKSELENLGVKTIVLKEPTNSIYGKKIKQSLNKRLSAEEELELFLLDRKYDVEKNILPALKAGFFVIMDRYYYSTMAYQGARGIDFEEIRKMNEQFAPKPDLVIILDLEPDMGLKRVKQRGDKPNEFEDLNYLKKVREIFLKLKNNVVVVDASRDLETVKRDVLNIVKKFLKVNIQNFHRVLE